jgi:nicotinamidase-related amidase
MTSLPPRNPPEDDLLAPENSALVLIDFQPAQIYTSISSEPDFLVRNVVSLAKVGKLFDLPIVLSTAQVSAGLNGDTIPQLREQLVGVTSYDRTAINAWEDQDFVGAVRATGRKKLIMAALWTDASSSRPSQRSTKDSRSTPSSTAWPEPAGKRTSPGSSE